MRSFDRPSRSANVEIIEDQSISPERDPRLRKILARANPSMLATAAVEAEPIPRTEVRFVRTPDHLLPQRRAGVESSGVKQDTVLSGAPHPASDGAGLPSWFEPFTMPSQARFTRTPDYLLREPGSFPRSVALDHRARKNRADTPPIDDPARIPSREERLAKFPQVVQPSVAAHESEDAAVPSERPPVPSLRGLAGAIQVGTTAPVSTHGEQDNVAVPMLAADVPVLDERSMSAPGSGAGKLSLGSTPSSVVTVTASFSWSGLSAQVADAPVALLPAAEEPEQARVAPEWAPAETVPTCAVAQRASASTETLAKNAPHRSHGFVLPPLSLLTAPTASEPAYEASEEYLDKNSVILQQTLSDFGVRGEIIDANPGPVVTLYELEPAPGTKSSRVIGLSTDIARSMSAVSARVAVLPGRNAIGIELPNRTRETVLLRELLASQDFTATKQKLALCLGKNIGGEPIIADLARMPHLLVAGTTGSGKSVAINTMILSLLYMHTPEQCRLIMVDPKMLELSVYEGIPHLLTPVVTDPKKAVVALKWAVREMEDRYRKMSKLGVRNIDGFNARVLEMQASGDHVTDAADLGSDEASGTDAVDLTPLPYIVVIVDEMADLMMVAGKDIEGAIQRLAQMARAAGIHLIMATQRPSVDVITGTVKANFPTRISFQVTSKIDSRTILGEMGAEQLLGQGDMLYMMGGGRITRVHGPFVSDAEVEKVVAHLKAQGGPEYLEEVTSDDDAEDASSPLAPSQVPEDGPLAISEDGEDVYVQAVQVVMRDRRASTSYIQRRLGIGYNRAASIMERMENESIVGPANHAGKREILRAIRQAATLQENYDVD